MVAKIAYRVAPRADDPLPLKDRDAAAAGNKYANFGTKLAKN